MGYGDPRTQNNEYEKYRVDDTWPNSHFKPGDILEESERIPSNCVGKFIDETTGWAWVENPDNFPKLLVGMGKSKLYDEILNFGFQRL